MNLPVAEARRTLGKLETTVSAKRASVRFALPGTLFCSWISVGILSVLAANTGGRLTYPPVPTTACGRNLNRIVSD